MKGTTHQLIVGISLACLDESSRQVLFPRWRGILDGATLTDEFRAYWDPMGDSDRKHLIHRCFVDSDDPKNHGAIEHLLNYSTGSVGFVGLFLDGDLGDAYSEVSFLENFGMYLGIVSHHICDICTPVHVGHRLNFRKLGYPTLARFHGKVERDIARFARPGQVTIPQPQKVQLTGEYFWSIAKSTYDEQFTTLEDLYLDDDREGIAAMSRRSISRALKHTVDVWATIMSESGITAHNWTIEPLI